MKPVRFLLVLAAIAILMTVRGLDFTSLVDPPPPAKERAGAAIRQSEFQELIDRGQALAGFAVPGQYTVVEVYLDSCAICRNLESSFGAFTDKRRDVIIQRVHFPEDGLQLEITGTTQAEVETQARSIQALMKPICGTPHVEIYGPDRKALARDLCVDRRGTRYLRGWISAETTLGDMLATGAKSTPLPRYRTDRERPPRAGSQESPE